jgi:hypothetical protein
MASVKKEVDTETIAFENMPDSNNLGSLALWNAPMSQPRDWSGAYRSLVYYFVMICGVYPSALSPFTKKLLESGGT